MTMESRHETLGAPQTGPNLAGLAWVVLAVCASLPVFWFGFEGQVNYWTPSARRLQMILPFISLLLMLQVMRSVPATAGPAAGRWVGVVGVVAALLLALLANLLRIDSFVIIAVIAWIAGMIVACVGLRHGLAFWAPVASLLLIVPYPQFVVMPVGRLLEGLVAGLGVAVLRVMGVPVRVDGQVIDFGVQQLRIADVLPGPLVFPLVLMAGFAFVTLYRRPFWIRVLPLVLAVPVMLGFAVVRVVAVGLAVDRAGGAAADRALQISDSWMYFGVSILALLVFVAVARRLAGDRGSIFGRLDVDLADLGAQARRFLAIPATPALISAALATAVLSAVFAIGPSRPTVPIEREAFALFPADIGGMAGLAQRDQLGDGWHPERG